MKFNQPYSLALTDDTTLCKYYINNDLSPIKIKINSNKDLYEFCDLYLN